MSCDNLLPTINMPINDATSGPNLPKNKLISKIVGDVEKTPWDNNTGLYYYNLKDSNNDKNKNVFKFLKPIEDEKKKKNNNFYDKLSDAINLAACGKWCNSDINSCRAPWGDSSKAPYKNTNTRNTIALEEGDSVKGTLINITTETPLRDLLACSINDKSAGKTVPMKVYTNSVVYLINRYLADKARFFNSDANIQKNAASPGDIWKLFRDSKVSQLVKVFLLITILLTVYLLLRGITAVSPGIPTGNSTNNLPKISLLGADSAFPNMKSLIVFLGVWYVVAYISGINFYNSDKSRTTTRYNLSTGSKDQSSKLTTPCGKEDISKSNYGSTSIALWLSGVLVAISLIVMAKMQGQKGNYIFIFANWAVTFMLAGYIYYITLSNKYSPTTDESKNFNLKFLETCSGNDTTFRLGPTRSINVNAVNYHFWIALVVIVFIVSITNTVLSVILTGNKSISNICKPWLLLRSPLIISINVLFMFVIPYFLILYPILCMLQRMLCGSVIIPSLEKIFTNTDGSSQNSSTKSVLFGILVGWDLLLWPFFKIPEVYAKLYKGESLDDLIKGDETSNMNVFSNFEEFFNLSWIYKIFLALWPAKGNSFICDTILNKNWRVFFTIVLGVLVGLLSMYIIRVLLNFKYLTNFSDFFTWKNIYIVFIVYIIIYFLMALANRFDWNDDNKLSFVFGTPCP